MPMKYSPVSTRSRRGTRSLFLAACWPLLAVGCGPVPSTDSDTGAADAAIGHDAPLTCGDACTSVLDSGTVTDSGTVIATDAGVDAPVNPSDVPAIVDATAVTDSGPADTGSVVDPRLFGTYRLGIEVEFDLVIDEDGSFRWHREDCASTSNDCGRWRAEGNDLVLSPADGFSSFDWFASTFRESASVVRITRGSMADEVIVRGMVGTRAARPFEQTWTRGRVCAVCSGGTATVAPCATDVPVCTH